MPETQSNGPNNIARQQSLLPAQNIETKQALKWNNFSFNDSAKFAYIARSEINGRYALLNVFNYPYDKRSSSVGRLKNRYDQDSGSISGDPLRFSDRYTYQMQPWDLTENTRVLSQERLTNSRYSHSVARNLEDFRSSVGILTHGDNEVARTMKYFMYNRWKVPDTNLLMHKTMTYVFFTRPDLNLLLYDSASNRSSILPRLKNNSEVALIYQRYPELFKLLTYYKRCGDLDNFNMLLSNQLTAFDISDEKIETVDAGKSWSDYAMPYGGSYTGRTSGEFNCTFKETSDLSVITLLKLWLTYIDNVSRGLFFPSYNLYPSSVNFDKNPAPAGSNGNARVNNSHVFTKTLDYAASAYLFICDQTGEEILFWSKYYGVYPTSTGSAALSWSGDQSTGNSQPSLSIPFRYAWKKDMNPVSLLEFNQNADIKVNASGTTVAYEPSYDPHAATGGRPFVMTPFIALDLVNPPKIQGSNLGMLSQKRTHIYLRFKKTEFDDKSPLRDSKLYSYMKYN